MSSDPLDTITDWPEASQKLATQLSGPLFAGWVTHMILFGLVQSQFAAYTSTELYAKDPRRVKAFLWTVVGLDFAATFLNAEQMYHYGTDQHRDYASLYITRPVDSVPNLLCAAIALLVQVFLLKRASALFSHHLLRWWFFVGSVTFLATMSFLAACGSFTVGIMWGYGLVERALPFTYNNLTSTWLMTSLSVDCALCLTLVLLLRKRFDTQSRDSPVRRLISTTIQSAALTAIFGLVGAILSCFPQSNDATANVPLFWVTPLPSLYALALITTLASRGGRAPALVTGTVLNVADILSPNPSAQLSSNFAGGAAARGEFVSGAAGEKSWRPSAAEVDEEEEDEYERDDDDLEVGEKGDVRLEQTAFSGLQTTARPIPTSYLLTSEEANSTRDDDERQQIRWA